MDARNPSTAVTHEGTRLVFSPTSVFFASTRVGTSSASKQTTVTNQGGSPLVVSTRTADRDAALILAHNINNAPGILSSVTLAAVGSAAPAAV